MKITRERTEILLMEYAAGSLDEAGALLVASYITLCPQARSFAVRCESLGGALIEYGCTPVAMSEGSIKAILARIDDDAHESAAPCAAAADIDCRGRKIPEPLRQYMAAGARRRARWISLLPGLAYCRLPIEEPGAQAFLVGMEPGARALAHRHDGVEYTLVLDGSFSDELGDFHAGEMIVIDDPDIMHKPVAGPEGCLCLITAHAPVRFEGFAGKLMNFLMRF